MNRVKFLITLSAVFFLAIALPSVQATNGVTVNHTELYDTSGTLMGTYVTNYGLYTSTTTIPPSLGATWNVTLVCDTNVSFEWQSSAYNARDGSWLYSTSVTTIYLSSGSYSFDIGADPTNYPTGYTLYVPPGSDPVSIAVTINIRDNSTGAILASGYSSVAVTPPAGSTGATTDWIYGIIMVLVIFAPAWVLNMFIPRYGLILGLVVMAIAIGLSDPAFLWVTFVMVIGCGIMVYSMGDV